MRMQKYCDKFWGYLLFMYSYLIFAFCYVNLISAEVPVFRVSGCPIRHRQSSVLNSAQNLNGILWNSGCRILEYKRRWAHQHKFSLLLELSNNKVIQIVMLLVEGY